MQQPVQSHHHITIDCSNAHRGLFAGILVIVLTIISLIMFFVLANEPGSVQEKLEMRSMAEFEVNVVELVLYLITTVSVLAAMYQMRVLKYERKLGGKLTSKLFLSGASSSSFFRRCSWNRFG